MRNFKRRKDSTIILLIFLSGFVLFHFAGKFAAPLLVYDRQKQPVGFNHAKHGDDVGVSCDTCHFFYDDGSWSGIPKMEVCANCHSEVLGESEEEKKLVMDFIQQNREVEWGLYFRQPQCVSFSHSSHVRGAKLSCETCHGPQGLSRSAVEYLTNRITKYSYVVYDTDVSLTLNTVIGKKEKNIWGTMGMDECAACHRARGTSTACFICHK
ncbi:MAG: cytochrome C [Candidatus Abyssobacteria bacterium SURF_5]|uniref:Cytochrome C n=1 Tax=Abyssobacteria bacterium (strain SURF_5) TaxID=2093360 RepID=A0A3A4NFE4_ABYX5|nr:MAG: cytochrome C [Candidatus Abyssubacteria bacterium SURF_5]